MVTEQTGINSDSNKTLDLKIFNRMHIRSIFVWIGCAFLLIVILGVSFSKQSSNFINIVTSLFIYGSIMLWIFVKFKSNKVNWRKFIGPIPLFNLQLITESILVLFALMIFSFGSAYITFWIVLAKIDFPFKQIIMDMPKQISGLESVIFFVIFNNLIVPIVEEIFFRGLLLHRLASKYGIWPGIILVSIAFGIVHVNPIGAIAVSVVFSLIYIKTKTLFLPIVFHIMNNSIIDIISVLFKGDKRIVDFSGILLSLQKDLPIAFSSLVAGAFLLVIARKLYVPKSNWILPYESK